MVRALLFFFSPSMRGFTISSLAALAANFILMGAPGFLFCYPAVPILRRYFAVPSVNALHGDWVWPTAIGIGFLWGFTFVIFGFLRHFIPGVSRWPTLLLVGIYLLGTVVLCSGVWVLAVASHPEGIDTTYRAPSFPSDLVENPGNLYVDVAFAEPNPSRKGPIELFLRVPFERESYRGNVANAMRESLFLVRKKPGPGFFLVGVDAAARDAENWREEKNAFSIRLGLAKAVTVPVADMKRDRARLKKGPPFRDVLGPGIYELQWWDGRSMSENPGFSKVAPFEVTE